MPDFVNEFSFTQWPVDVPRPTDAELAAADLRYKATLAEGDYSDYPLGLGFVMSTYNRCVWWQFFFPDTDFTFANEIKKCRLP